MKTEMKKELLYISIRKNAIYLPAKYITERSSGINPRVASFLVNIQKLGFNFSEPLMYALNHVPANELMLIIEVIKSITRVDQNWTPLVKEWNIPTGESFTDHLMTFFANYFKLKKGTRLPCNHIIPLGTFPLERYNGCPYCGTPFTFEDLDYKAQGNKFKTLDLWTDKDMERYFHDLLISKTALDATQADNLKKLLNRYSIPQGIKISMKETVMMVVDCLLEKDRVQAVGKLFKNPNDILRYLWYKHTGFLQIIEPKVILDRLSKNHQHFSRLLDDSRKQKKLSKKTLKLKYARKECRQVADWLNDLSLDVQKSCEIMHPKRNMWIRFIRALRLAEYAKRKGYEKLSMLLDTFYNKNYTVWQGRVNHFRLRSESHKTFALLKERPGLFVRSLFANMLWFGPEETLRHFREVMDKIPARLLLTLNMYADYYFDKNMSRSVKTLGGTSKRIPANKLLGIYSDRNLKDMKANVEALCLEYMKNRFAKIDNTAQSIFIDEALFNIPLSIGDRSDNVQDIPHALTGTRFPIEGTKVRLFMQWGNGLKAQHLDMDLSAMVAYSNKTDYCSYLQLTIPGCQHSGDIRSIPDKVGTAEYIEIDVERLYGRGAEYVSFTCNAYSQGAISPGLIVGWMDSKYPMTISKSSGVAYDPSCVQHQVRITNKLTKGIVFGVLDVKAREIIWLELAFGGQVVQSLDIKNVKALIRKLDNKMSVGNLLKIKAEAQNLTLIQDQTLADEVYDLQWAYNTAAVTQLLVD